MPHPSESSGAIIPTKKKNRSTASRTSWMIRNTNLLLRSILATSLEPDDVAVSSKPGFETLCSYNWLNDGSAIIVPGGPPQWNPQPLPITLPQDTGRQFVDLNAFRIPRYPFEPAFRALSAMNTGAQLDDVDIILNRNSLRKLLDFAAGRRQDPFRVDLNMVKNTLFISRKEKTAQRMIHGAANSGYGHSFETAFTKPQTGLNQSSSHHRVIRYKLGGLDCVVRFEVDAYYEEKHTQGPSTAAGVLIDDIVTSLTSLSFGQTQASEAPEGSTRVIMKGPPVRSEKLAELKAHKVARTSQAMPQLWFGRTHYLITGKHTEGTVHSISCNNIEEKFEDWETTNQQTLRKLVSLLKELKGIASTTKDRTAIVLCKEKGAPLTVFSTKQTITVLPTDITRRHWKPRVKSRRRPPPQS
ncbi:uncharacterized protein EKO05_0007612 [Ascochyta rabiei]|nr:uncharacterized protein EKO05_0007612 [Ascochyta rabiei]UPX17246.1 hypothetical protein EKO05_0007612 [Ascochyta rabiei]